MPRALGSGAERFCLPNRKPLSNSFQSTFSGTVMNPDISPLTSALANIAHEAGRLILKHYVSGIEARSKADASPVTQADEQAEALILDRLKTIAPGTPIVAEEEVAAGRVPQIGSR